MVNELLKEVILQVKGSLTLDVSGEPNADVRQRTIMSKILRAAGIIALNGKGPATFISVPRGIFRQVGTFAGMTVLGHKNPDGIQTTIYVGRGDDVVKIKLKT